jgi:hypothetical protein
MYKGYAIVLCLLIIGWVGILFFRPVLNITPKKELDITPKEETVEFKIGHCYMLKDDDPFETEKIMIKVVDIKKGYMQYYFSGTPKYLHSDYILGNKRIFTEINCEELK